MTRDELKKTLQFMESPAGKKFRLATASVKDSDLGPIFKEACQNTQKSLDSLGIRDTGFEQECAQYN
jgi:hypothetical protein